MTRKRTSFIYLSSLHLNVKYPKKDVFEQWFSHIQNLSKKQLKEGIQARGFLITNGTRGYRFCLRQPGVKISVSDRIAQPGADDGSGILVELSDKYLIDHYRDIHSPVDRLLKSIGVFDECPISIPRINLSMDILGYPFYELGEADFKYGWVGRSSLSDLHYNTDTNNLEAAIIGSLDSPVTLHIYDKVARAFDSGDTPYWQDIWQDHIGPVTTLEWNVKPIEGNFEACITQFNKFSEFGTRKLLAYLLTWGRLCIPDERDSNNRRWKDTELWELVKACALIWLHGCGTPVSRFGKCFHGITLAYVNLVSGIISSAIAKFGYQTESLSIETLFDGLKLFGVSKEKILMDAKRKAEVLALK
jgi:hypothetical protein